MPRIRIWTAPDRLTGEAVAEELRLAGIPVVGMAPGSDIYPTTSLYDLYLEDENLLKDPVVKLAIDEATQVRPLTAEEEIQVEQMPFEESLASGAAILANGHLGNRSNRPYVWLAMLLMVVFFWLALGYVIKLLAGAN